MLAQEMVPETASVRSISELDRMRLLREWNATDVDVPRNLSVAHLFARQARATPRAVAVQSGNETVSYEELDARARSVASYLVDLYGVRPNQIVGLCVNRSVDLVVGLLGILKAGAAYVPLDPGYPMERLGYMLSDSGTNIVLTQHDLAGHLPRDCTNIRLDADRAVIERWRPQPANSDCAPEHLAYVIYTSGSTGRPKGVLMPHRGLTNQMLWIQRAFPLNAADVVLQKTPLSFDASIWEVLAPLLSGARLVMAPPQAHKDPAFMCELVRTYGVTTLQLVPSMLRLFLNEPKVSRCYTLRNVFSGGEALTTDVCEKFFAIFKAGLHNLYGPTETCIQSVAYTCTGREINQPANVPIGRPIANTKVYVLDEQYELVPIGAVGELHIGGAGLARGYIGRADLTAERFVPNPFGPAGSKLYRTGDVVKYRPDGLLEFVGRADGQLKVRGFRIEASEVEAAVMAHESVREVAVTAEIDPTGGARLAAYVVPRPGRSVSSSELRQFLKSRIPEYMVPSLITSVRKLPRMPNGKVDRRALSKAGNRPRTPTNISGAISSMQSFLADMVLPPSPAEQHCESAADIHSVLAEIWRAVLGVESVGRDEDFFDLGGTSLALVHMVAQANERLGTSVAVAVVSEGATIAALAPHFASSRNKSY